MRVGVIEMFDDNSFMHESSLIADSIAKRLDWNYLKEEYKKWFVEL